MSRCRRPSRVFSPSEKEPISGSKAASMISPTAMAAEALNALTPRI